jgi:hypothetical protein
LGSRSANGPSLISAETLARREFRRWLLEGMPTSKLTTRATDARTASR